MPAIVIALLIYFYRPQTQTGDWQRKNITVGDKNLKVYVAETAESRERGLAGFQALADDEGMLFVFEEADVYAFWMKAMEMPIDIIWIKEGQVMGITPNIAPESNVEDEKLTKYYPPTDIDTVLEVRAGWAEKYEIKIEDSVNDF